MLYVVLLFCSLGWSQQACVVPAANSNQCACGEKSPGVKEFSTNNCKCTFLASLEISVQRSSVQTVALGSSGAATCPAQADTGIAQCSTASTTEKMMLNLCVQSGSSTWTKVTCGSTNGDVVTTTWSCSKCSSTAGVSCTATNTVTLKDRSCTTVTVGGQTTCQCAAITGCNSKGNWNQITIDWSKPPTHTTVTGLPGDVVKFSGTGRDIYLMANKADFDNCANFNAGTQIGTTTRLGWNSKMVNSFPAYFADKTTCATYKLAVTLGSTPAVAPSPKLKMSLTFGRTQKTCNWILSNGQSAADWRATFVVGAGTVFKDGWNTNAFAITKCTALTTVPVGAPQPNPTPPGSYVALEFQYTARDDSAVDLLMLTLFMNHVVMGTTIKTKWNTTTSEDPVDVYSFRQSGQIPWAASTTMETRVTMEMDASLEECWASKPAFMGATQAAFANAQVAITPGTLSTTTIACATTVGTTAAANSWTRQRLTAKYTMKSKTGQDQNLYVDTYTAKGALLRTQFSTYMGQGLSRTFMTYSSSSTALTNGIAHGPHGVNPNIVYVPVHVPRSPEPETRWGVGDKVLCGAGVILAFLVFLCLVYGAPCNQDSTSTVQYVAERRRAGPTKTVVVMSDGGRTNNGRQSEKLTV